ncbi:MAG: dockerin type I repeat-containing protein [Burkholderiales bacterium]|nr:dockerin type I repeat-containing protein [Burkholderiales bacterium]
MKLNLLKNLTARGGWRRLGTALALTAMLALQPEAQAASGWVNTGAGTTLVGRIDVGQTQVDVPIAVSAMNSLQLQAIVPVPGATITLLDPNGATVVAPNDPGLSYADGQSLSPPLPGGAYITPVVTNPVDGNWVLRARFPAAPTKTIALVTVQAASAYQVGLVQTGQTYYVGQPVPLGLLAVHNGAPISGLQPTAVISKDGAALVNVDLVDDGRADGYDGLANDGIYSTGVKFNSTGRYLIEARVTIPVAGGSITRTAAGFVDVVPRNYALNAVTGGFSTGAGGCIAQLNVNANATVQRAGTYSTAATLRGPDGHTLVKRTNNLLASPGTFDATVAFTSREVRSHFVQGGAFTIDPLEVVSVANDISMLEVRSHSAYIFPNFALAQFCVDPIEVGLSASVVPVLRAPFIGQLNFALPISVTASGNYQISFKITDALGQQVGQFAVNQFLSAGNVNTIAAQVPAAMLQVSDGPFNVESVLVVGAGNSAQASRVPVAASGYSRWQFFPTITGDLNGDGSVDAADRDILLSFRNAQPMVPGDRRDLNGDGKIDLLDARLIVLRACKSPNCPRN